MYGRIATDAIVDKDSIPFDADCILFDIDGVLVDIRRSYNTAIKRTVDFVVSSITEKKKYNFIVTDDIILRFRQSGGFNNDTDTSYAITLSILSANDIKNIESMRKFILNVARHADRNGISTVEKHISSFYDIEKVKEILGYPAPVGKSLLATVFDEIFYGKELFRKQNRIEPRYYFGEPMIKNDKLVVKTDTMEWLLKRFDGRLALVSGRSRLAAEYSLKPVYGFFFKEACVYLEDEKREYAKPNPYAIIKAMDRMGSKAAVYAGDSTEDQIMARDAEKQNGAKISFFGIYQNSTDPAEAIAQFKKNNAEAIIKSVNMLPNILNKVLVKK